MASNPLLEHAILFIFSENWRIFQSNKFIFTYITKNTTNLYHFHKYLKIIFVNPEWLHKTSSPSHCYNSMRLQKKKKWKTSINNFHNCLHVLQHSLRRYSDELVKIVLAVQLVFKKLSKMRYYFYFFFFFAKNKKPTTEKR